MKFIYPAVFRKNEEGRYKAFFPDLACCEAEGDTLDDAIDNANEAAYNWIYAEVMEDEMDLPAISDESDLDLLEGDIVRNIPVSYTHLFRKGDYDGNFRKTHLRPV